MTAVFYSGTKNASSWAMRAWLALREQDIEFEENVVDIRRPQRFVNLQGLSGLSPSRSVPILDVDGVAIFDSLAIMEYASEQGDGSLLPEDPVTRARARSWLAWQHAGLSMLCPKISFESAFYPQKRVLTDSELVDCERLFAALESELEASGGPYLFGDLSLADINLAPTVIRLDAHAPDMREWPLARQYFDAFLQRDSVREWLSEANTLPHVWLDDYLSGIDKPQWIAAD